MKSKEIGKQPAFARADGPDYMPQIGLTKFEWFMGQAMIGILSADSKRFASSKEVAKIAFEQAKDMLELLDGQITDEKDSQKGVQTPASQFEVGMTRSQALRTAASTSSSPTPR